MTLLLFLSVAAALLLVMVLLAGRRHRRGPADGPRSPGAPAHGSTSRDTWTLGGGGTP